MQVKANLDALLKSFDNINQEINARLKHMVIQFAYNITLTAIDNTPFGSMNSSYLIESRRGYYAPMPGTAKGGWYIRLDSSEARGYSLLASSAEADNIKSKAKTDLNKFQLGDTISIRNDVKYMTQEGFTQPQFGSIESGYSKQAPYGVFEPTFDTIMSVYNYDYKTLYDSYTLPT